MSMISELVKGLRKLGNQWKHNDVAGFNLIFDAADTIETLSEKVRANNLHNGWIPVSEMLPQINVTVITCDADGFIHLDYIIKLGDSSLGFCQNVAYGDSDIIAWMPLPEPYREDGEA